MSRITRNGIQQQRHEQHTHPHSLNIVSTVTLSLLIMRKCDRRRPRSNPITQSPGRSHMPQSTTRDAVHTQSKRDTINYEKDL